METVQPTQSDFQELFDLPVKTPRAHTTALAEILQLPNSQSRSGRSDGSDSGVHDTHVGHLACILDA